MSCIETENRIDPLISQIKSRQGSFVSAPDPLGQDIALYRAFTPGISRLQWRARFLLEEVRGAVIEFPANWSLAGEHLPKANAEPWFRTHPNELPKDDRHNQDEWEAVRKVVVSGPTAGMSAFVGEQSLDTIGGPNSSNETPNFAFSGWGWIENHSIRNYAIVLEKGYGGLQEEVEAELAKLLLEDPETPQRENVLTAMLSVCQAGVLLGNRYAEEAETRAAKTAAPEEKSRLLKMAQACKQVPSRGAQTFAEAVQSLWLAHILTCGEDGINANSLGRIDKILFPYYQADLNAGNMTRETAIELMAEFACKLYLDYDVQTITLGGQTEKGNDATNALSEIILEATRQVGFIRALNIRIHPKSPDAFLEQAAKNILRGGGIPYLFNDDCFIPALADRGIDLEDARDYAVIGCVELTIPGKANPRAVSGRINALKCLELALHGGIDPKTGDQVGPVCRPLNQLSSFDDLMENYRLTVDVLARKMVYLCNRGEMRQREQGMLPCWSLLTDDCLERGRDITDGGARYNYHSICFMAAPNAADALMAVKTLVFDEQSVNAGDLLTALKEDFVNAETLRQRLIHGAEKYGNNLSAVDALAGELCDHFIDLMDGMRSPLGGRYYVHLFSFLWNIGFGEMTGATPDGRHAGQPFAYSLSAHPGRDEAGLTAMLNSLAALPHRNAAGGSAAIIDIAPSLFEGENGAARLAQVIRAAFAMGVGQLQFNVVTEEAMRKAKECPETHGNLQVRVAGYSQMFKLLTPELQDHLIARTKHNS